MSQFSEGDLERIVGDALAADRAVPTEWREAARAAYTWRTVDDELLALTYDSRLEAGAAVRGPGEGRTLEFSGAGLTLELALTGPRIMGRLATPVSAEVVLERNDGSRRPIATDESGFFALEGEDPGLVRFVVRVGEQRLVTEWVRL